MSTFLDLADLRQIGWANGRPLWLTLAPLRYESDVLGACIDIPPEFITDLASVPRMPVLWLAAGGRGIRSSVIHDFVCQFGFWWLVDGRRQYVEQWRAHAVFHESLLADPISGAGPWRAWQMWAGVRVRGRGVWADEARRKTLNPEWSAGRWEAP